MMKTLTLFCLLTAAVAPAMGCKGSDGPAAEKPTSAQSALSAEVATRIQTSLADYESRRAALAADRLGDVAGIAARLESSANAAKQGAPAQVTTRLGEMASAAASLKSGKSADDARHTFGDLSRAVVSLLSQNTTLAQGRFVFRCPMAPGYQKWVQTGERLENPYMGGRMLRCGSASKWRP